MSDLKMPGTRIARPGALFSVIALIVAAGTLAFGATAASADHTVTFCHVPPGNPENGNTITTSNHGIINTHLGDNQQGGFNHPDDFLGPCEVTITETETETGETETTETETEPETGVTETTETTEVPAPPGDTAAAETESDDALALTGFPALLVAIGGVGLAGLGFAVRRRMTSDL